MNSPTDDDLTYTIIGNLGSSNERGIIEDGLPEVGYSFLVGQSNGTAFGFSPDAINQGRNAAKRAARARIYKGPAKTPKGMKK